MKKIKITHRKQTILTPIKLQDFSLFEEKMTKIKYLKALKRDMDKSDLLTVIDELELSGKKITAKRVKKVFKKALINMIEEVNE